MLSKEKNRLLRYLAFRSIAKNMFFFSNEIVASHPGADLGFSRGGGGGADFVDFFLGRPN